MFVFNQKTVDLKPSFSNILKCLSIYDMALVVSQGTVVIENILSVSDTGQNIILIFIQIKLSISHTK